MHWFWPRLCACFRRVHVSESTKEALNGAYETEPGHGGERDGYLEKAGIQTYLIVEKVHTSSSLTLDNDASLLSTRNLMIANLQNKLETGMKVQQIKSLQIWLQCSIC